MLCAWWGDSEGLRTGLWEHVFIGTGICGAAKELYFYYCVVGKRSLLPGTDSELANVSVMAIYVKQPDLSPPEGDVEGGITPPDGGVSLVTCRYPPTLELFWNS